MPYKRQQVKSGSRQKISAGSWNGFGQMYADFYQGAGTPETSFSILRNSVIVPAYLKSGSEKIAAFTPCIITKAVNLAEPGADAVSYEVASIESPTTSNVGYANTYAFTTWQGIGEGSGGYIVISGAAIVECSRDQVGGEPGIPLSGDFDSLWYSPPDGSLVSPLGSANYLQILGPTGHFKVFSGYDAAAVANVNNKYYSDSVFVAIDMNSRPDKISLWLQSDIDPATTDATGAIFDSGWGSVYYPDAQRQTNYSDVSLENNTGKNFSAFVFNPHDREFKEDTFATASWSELYNCFLLDSPGGGDGSVFPIELTLHANSTSGPAGSSTEKCQFRYNVRKFEEPALLGVDVDPEASPNRYRREELGERSPADFGMATYDEDGDLVIIYINEVMKVSTC